jgi:PAS domain S-box-containing protein
MTEDAARISLASSTLGETQELQRRDVDASGKFSDRDVTQLGDCLNHLGSIIALPADWVGAEPSQIVSRLVDALIGMLPLSFVCVRLSDREGRPSSEVMRVADSVGGMDRAREIREAIDSSLGAPLAAVSVGDVDLSVASAPLGLCGEIGIIVAGSQRPDFPAQTERLLLDVVANQATIGLQQAYLAAQRRAGEALDARVAQRTRELAIAYEELRDSERKFRLLVETIPALVWRGTSEGELDYLNERAVEYLGHTAQSLIGGGWIELVHPDHRDATVRRWLHSATTGSSYDDIYKIRRADGQYRWIQSIGEPFYDTEGRIVHWYGLIIDIDDRKRAEQELRRSEARKATILDSALDCIVSIDREGCITEFNPAAERTFGYRRDEVVGQELADVIIPPALRERHRQGFTRYLATGEAHVLGRRIEMTAIRADGSEFPTELAITRIPSDGPPSFTGYLRDITERKRSEEELRRSEAFLAEAQHLSRVGSFSWRVATDEIMWSEQLYRIFEIDRDVRVTFEVIGTRVHPEDVSVFQDQIERSRRDGSNMQLEIRLQMPDGAVKYVHVVAHCRDDGGQLEYIGAVQDVTQRRLSEATLAKVRSELASVARNTSLGVLTASIAHEVNQPLAGIVTNASTCLRMLGADPPDVDGARETARRTIRDGNRASDVITRLRALFSKKEFTLEPLDLNEATREVIALSLSDLQRHRVILQSELADDLPILTGDRIQLQQVILNLLRNASEAMDDVHERPRLLLIKTEREDGDRVRLSVRDAGIGLVPQSLDSLFDAFYTTKSGGMGIGLFVSRSIVERHQGRLWAEPNDGPGATFSFSLPFQTA